MSYRAYVSNLLHGLMEKTEQRKIRWEPTASMDSFLTAVGGKYSVILEKVGDEYILTVEDVENRDKEPVKIISGSEPSTTAWLRTLYHLIDRNRGRDIEETVGGVLEALKAL